MRNMKRAAELVQCAVILHNLCIIFSDNGDDLLDDVDLDIVDDELDIDHGEDNRTDGSSCCSIFYECEENVSYNLRGDYILSLPKPKSTTYGLNSVRYIGPKLSNSIPNMFRNMTNFKSFKRSISQVDLVQFLLNLVFIIEYSISSFLTFNFIVFVEYL